MKSIFIAGAVLVLMPPVRAADTAPPPNLPPGYHLVWSDEYSKQPDGLVDPKKWSYEVGFVRNNEQQFYTNARKENCRIEHGHLIIEGRKEEYAANPKAPPAHYTSAAIESVGKADWLYGRIEVRAKLPAGKGVWPAIWTLGSDYKEPGVGWPRCGEIDIMELVGKKPGTIYGTLHYFANGKHEQSQGNIQLDHPENDFHVYATEWTPDFIDIFVDNTKIHHFDVSKADHKGQNPFRKKQYLLLNLAIGGSWGGEIDDSIFPQRMTIDYVRVYQKNTTK